MRYAVIIAGGAGTRLWPMSRKGQPKQLLRFIKGQSLLNLSIARLRGLIAPEGIYICTGADYMQAILREISMLPEAQILGEPMGRDTANAVGLSAAVLMKKDPDATMAILTADHVIEPIDAFQNALTTAFNFVDQHPETLVTFGIKPTHAATGYGYVQKGEAIEPKNSPAKTSSQGALALDPPHSTLSTIYKVLAFREKPNQSTAEQYVASGQYFWNSGMFVFKASTMMEQLKQHLPQSYEGLIQIAAAWGTPKQKETLEKIYPNLPKISIDFAVMEKAPHVAMVPMDLHWLDVGSWSSFAQTLKADQNNNRTAGCNSIFLDSTNTLAVSETGHLITTIGTQDLIIIHTPQATLVCAAKDAEKIKQLVDEVKKTQGEDFV